MARTAGIEYAALVLNICELAMARKRAHLTPEHWALAQQLSGMHGGAAPELQLFAGGQR
jgi:hypothetical protein